MTFPGKTCSETRKIQRNLICKSQIKLRLATVNVEAMAGRSTEVIKTIRRQVDVVALQEVWYRNEEAK